MPTGMAATAAATGIGDMFDNDLLDLGDPLPALNSTGHVSHCVRCLDGLPASLVEMDASR